MLQTGATTMHVSRATLEQNVSCKTWPSIASAGNVDHMPRCTKCWTKTETTRLDLCGRCYQRRYHGRDVDAECACCGQSDPRILVRRRLGGERAEQRLPGERRVRIEGGEMTTLCAVCAALATSPTMTLAELRALTPPPPSVRQRAS